MSDEGDKTCPLCAEEMDLTDQQLKPCKCGYEICVWCWHHIMDMAEKDESEGRCPACRAPYDKEKIVGMASKRESKLVAEIHMERKVKSQKAKAKSSDGRKQLSSVRVIQRNLVYIVGLPLNLADEELLQRREYFSQYGKVLKVSMSRTAAGVIQQYPNNTCSVYITYAREDEAVRCIQNVHGFVLEGRSLRACFGTTKYCHAWLRNVPCTNPDCLYLHEVGSQDDSFTKDEIISAYTRVQQITGVANSVQRRSGNVLPPPLDDYCTKSSASTEKPIPKNGTATIGSISRSSPPNGTAGRSISLPAAASWGTRGSNCQPLSANITCTNGPSKQKLELVSNTSTAGTNHSSTMQGKKHSFVEESHDINSKEKQETLRPVKQHSGLDCRNSMPEKSNAVDKALCPAIVKEDNRGIDMRANISDNSVDHDGRSSSSSGHENELMFASEDGNLNLCSEMSSMWNDRRNTMDGNFDEQSREPPTVAQQAETSSNEVSDWLSSSKMHVIPSTSSELEEDIISFDNQRLKDPEVMSRPAYMSHPTNSLHGPNHGGYSTAINLNAVNKHRDSVFGCSSSTPYMSNGFHSNMASGYDRISDHSFLPPNGDHMSMNSRRFVGEADDAEINSMVDRGESSIISNILSLDFDTWDQSLRSPQNLAKLLGDDEKQCGAHKMPSSWKPQPNNQSRFSFARQEDSVNQDMSRNYVGQLSNTRPFSHEFSDHRDSYHDNNHGYGNGFASGGFEESENYGTNHLSFQSNKPPVVSRAPISAPPGFSVPSRAPPPGFASHDRVDHSFDSLSGSRLLDNSSMLRNAYQQQHVSANMSGQTDIEFIDPAILAVGKGMLQGNGEIRSNYQSQYSPFENDARLHLLQRSLSSQQNVRFPDMGDSFSYNPSPSSRLVDQPHTGSLNNLSPFAQMSLQQSRNGMISNGPISNGHWDGWSEAQGGNNLIRNERVGFNKYYTGYEESKFRMPSSDMYNRTFGM